MRQALALFILIFLAQTALADQIYNYKNNIVHGPFNNQLIPDSEIYFSTSPDENHPVYMLMSLKLSANIEREEIIDKYDVAGGPPNIDSVFFNTVCGRKNIIVILSWNINSRGLGTYGKLYQIYPYKKQGNKLIKNEEISSDDNLSGLDGYQEGEETVFTLKTASDVKKYLRSKYSSPCKSSTK